jgi:hypothetical protein
MFLEIFGLDHIFFENQSKINIKNSQPCSLPVHYFPGPDSQESEENGDGPGPCMHDLLHFLDRRLVFVVGFKGL